MKPVHVVVLLLAGALSGALLMKFAHQEKPAVPVALTLPPVTAPEPAPVPVALTIPPVPAPERAPVPVRVAPPVPPVEAPEEPAKPSPMPVAKPKPARSNPFVVAVAPQPLQPPRPAPALVEPPPPEAPVPPPAEPAPATQPRQVTLNAGILLPVRLVEGISSERNAAGDAFSATLDQELVANGLMIADRGARVEGRVVAVDRAKPRAGAALALKLTALHTSDGQTVTIETDDYFKHADSARSDNTAKIAGGAVLGAVIGAIAGGGKGAAIGAGVGGGAGAGDVLLTKGKPVELASETLVTFKLRAPVPLTEKLQ